MGLTGGYRFRKGLRGKTVLQVEEEFTPFWSASGVVKRRWRDATMIDLADPTLRSLLDLGAGKLRFPSRSNALGGLLPNASRCLTLRGPHAGQQADRQQDELLLQLTDAVIIGESR